MTTWRGNTRVSFNLAYKLMLCSASNVLVPVNAYLQKTIITIEVPLDEKVGAVRRLVRKNRTTGLLRLVFNDRYEHYELSSQRPVSPLLQPPGHG
jgi:hypothetical protein